jgi:hypothetical protein
MTEAEKASSFFFFANIQRTISKKMHQFIKTITVSQNYTTIFWKAHIPESSALFYLIKVFISPVVMVRDFCLIPYNLFLIWIQGQCQCIGTGTLSFLLKSRLPLLKKREMERERNTTPSSTARCTEKWIRRLLIHIQLSGLQTSRSCFAIIFSVPNTHLSNFHYNFR